MNTAFHSLYPKISTTHSNSSIPHESSELLASYPLYQDAEGHLLQLIGILRHSISYPYTLILEATSCYGLLFTVSGNGRIHSDQEQTLLTERTIYFFSGNLTHTIESSSGSWEICLLYLYGEELSYFYRLFTHGINSPKPYLISPHSTFPHHINHLLGAKKEPSLIPKLKESEMLHTLLTDLIIEGYQTIPSSIIPDYILTMKNNFDHECQKDYSLDLFEDTLGISKYKLCHEFSKYFGIPPLKYLTQCRMQKACQLLEDTNLKIHQIGSMVGIDNTNHFINLFKRYTGLTPAIYRCQHLH